MLKKNRDELNNLIDRINQVDKQIDRLLKDEEISATTFDVYFDKYTDRLNNLLWEFTIQVDFIWYNNLDKAVQNSLNYYLTKAGLPTRKITALF